jgi:membrane protein
MGTGQDNIHKKQRDLGRWANAPTAMPWRGWRDILYRVFVGFGQNRILLTAAGVSFFMLFALVPSLSLFVTGYGLLNNPASVIDQLNLLEGVVPESGLGIIRDQLLRLTSQSTGSLGLALLISLVVAFWGASAGIKALFEAMNVVYGEIEKRNFFEINIRAMLFVIGAVAMLVIMLLVVLVMPPLLQFLALGEVEWLIRAVAYGIMLLALLASLSAIYRWGPSRANAKWRWITPGLIFSALGIFAMSAGYSYYAANFSNYDATYGSLGALIGFLTWIWLSITIVILGGSLNSEIEHQTAVDSTTGAPRPIGQRGAFVADSVGSKIPASGGVALENREEDDEVNRGS